MVERDGRGRNGGIITMNKKINAGLKITGIGCGQCGTQIIAEIEKVVNLLDGINQIFPLLESIQVQKIYHL